MARALLIGLLAIAFAIPRVAKIPDAIRVEMRTLALAGMMLLALATVSVC